MKVQSAHLTKEYMKPIPTVQKFLPVLKGGVLVGIFTETDAYKALSELLETRLKH